MKNIIFFSIILLMTLSLASAVQVKSVESDILSPGKDGEISIEIENPFEETVKDISLILDFTNLPFTPIGSSEATIDEIDDSDEEVIFFKIKASNNIVPGDYAIPYTLTFQDPDLETQKTKKGTVGITVKGNSDLSFTLSQDTPVIGQKSKITLKIVNKGFGDAKFVSIKVSPSGYTLFSESDVYIGEIESDDFETATFDVILIKQNAKFEALIEYKDFDNNAKQQTISLPLNSYTQERALELGIIQRNNIPYYIGGLILIVILFIIIRFLRKRARLRKSMQNRG